jgi:hypothetical protein
MDGARSGKLDVLSVRLDLAQNLPRGRGSGRSEGVEVEQVLVA